MVWGRVSDLGGEWLTLGQGDKSLGTGQETRGQGDGSSVPVNIGITRSYNRNKLVESDTAARGKPSGVRDCGPEAGRCMCLGAAVQTGFKRDRHPLGRRDREQPERDSDEQGEQPVVSPSPLPFSLLSPGCGRESHSEACRGTQRRAGILGQDESFQRKYLVVEVPLQVFCR